MHLIEPLGFSLDDKKLRRAGLDYHEWANVEIYEDIEAIQMLGTGTIYALSTRGVTTHTQPDFNEGDTFVFGPETRGLPQEYLDDMQNEHVLRLPMLPESRSLNLSNTVSIVVYEALRQVGFKGLT